MIIEIFYYISLEYKLKIKSIIYKVYTIKKLKNTIKKI